MERPIRLCTAHPSFTEAAAIVESFRFAFALAEVLQAPDATGGRGRAAAIGCLLGTAPFPVCMVVPALSPIPTTTTAME